MISNNPFGVYGTISTTNHTAKRLAEYAKTAAYRERTGLEGDGGEGSFASKLKKADEFMASGEYAGATDSIAIVLRQMDEPEAGKPATTDFWHNGAHVSITRDVLHGTSITIGGSANPDIIHVSTSVGVVNIDLNDMTSLVKCLDLFSPEDINAIMKKITEVKQAREAMDQIDRMEDELVKNGQAEKEAEGRGEGEQSVGEAVGVVSAEEMQDIEKTREKKFVG